MFYVAKMGRLAAKSAAGAGVAGSCASATTNWILGGDSETGARTGIYEIYLD